MSAIKPRPLDLALQGGGSHGAFTWGVLDRLLEEESIEFSAISGTSAGALNAAVLASGCGSAGRDGARKALRAFWLDVARAGAIFSPFSNGTNHNTASPFSFENLPGVQWMNSLMRSMSPYDFNPMNLNPLREVVEQHVNPLALQQCDFTLFVTATSVHTGQARVFTGAEVTVDALLASACLPFVFQAVEIEGEPYWDGGYTGNPAIYPLIYDGRSLDVLLVRINPLARPGTPQRSMDILDRLSEITFNASLIGEMRAIAFVSRLVREQKLDPGQYKDMRLHMVADDAALSPLSPSSKFNTDAEFLEQLFGFGRHAATAWLKKHGADIGVRGTLDIEATFLAKAKRRRR
ncbi:MAG TPA: patatin-like phospholipase family protein [Albitalea sp.]|nr:patatin-like phospholipase family protein [Albitalea sp.]